MLHELPSLMRILDTPNFFSIVAVITIGNISYKILSKISWFQNSRTCLSCFPYEISTTFTNHNQLDDSSFNYSLRHVLWSGKNFSDGCDALEFSPMLFLTFSSTIFPPFESAHNLNGLLREVPFLFEVIFCPLHISPASCILSFSRDHIFVRPPRYTW